MPTCYICNKNFNCNIKYNKCTMTHECSCIECRNDDNLSLNDLINHFKLKSRTSCWYGVTDFLDKSFIIKLMEVDENEHT